MTAAKALSWALGQQLMWVYDAVVTYPRVWGYDAIRIDTCWQIALAMDRAIPGGYEMAYAIMDEMTRLRERYQN